MLPRQLRIALLSQTWLLLAAGTAWGEAAGPAVELRFAAEAEVGPAIVRLGDLAEVIGAEEETARRLAGLELFPVPAAPRELNVQEVRELLTLAGVDMTRTRCAGASRIQLRPGVGRTAAGIVPSTPDPSVRVVAALAAVLREKVDPASQWRVEPRLSAKQAEAIATAELLRLAAPPTGEGLVQAEFLLGEGPGAESLRVPVNISRIRPLVVAARDLPAGSLVQPGDVRLTQFQETPRTGAIFTTEEVVGRELTRSVAAGGLVDPRSLRQPLLVHRGDVVHLFSRIGGVQVRTEGRALGEGPRNGVVPVQLHGSRDRVQARVIGYRECEVFAASPSVGR